MFKLLPCMFMISGKTLTLQSNYSSTLNNNDITLTTLLSLEDPVISITNGSTVSIIGLSIAANQTGIYLDNSYMELHKTIIFNIFP